MNDQPDTGDGPISFAQHTSDAPPPQSDVDSVRITTIRGAGSVPFQMPGDERCAHLGAVALDMETRKVVCQQCQKELDPFGYLTECFAPLAKRVAIDIQHAREYEKNKLVRKGHRQRTCKHTKAGWLPYYSENPPDGYGLWRKHCPTCGLDLEEVYVQGWLKPTDPDAKTMEVTQ